MNSGQVEVSNPGGKSWKPREAISRTRRGRSARPLFDCWPSIARLLHAARDVVLFVDFDGTLTPLRARPDDVPPLDASCRAILRRLARRQHLSAYVISGRRLAELRRLIRVPGVRLLGLHGWEGRGVPPLRKERELIRQARQTLQQRLAAIPKIWVEDKGLGLAVHYRGAPPRSIRLARPIVLGIPAIFGSQLHILRGHKVWEILPSQVDGKGSAVGLLLSGKHGGAFPIFVGDDVTDERAFAVLRGGLTVRVGNDHRTHAQYLLRDPEEVKEFLRKLEGEIA